jgi:hypothetical protein
MKLGFQAAMGCRDAGREVFRRRRIHRILLCGLSPRNGTPVSMAAIRKSYVGALVGEFQKP